LALIEEDERFLTDDQEGVYHPQITLTKREIIRITWKCYIPALAVGAATIGCIVGANHISLRRNAALASLYSLTEAAFKEYQGKVVETIGRNKELKVRDDISADQIRKNPPGTNEIIVTGKGDVLCYDSLSGRYFRSNIEQIRRSVNELNQSLLSEMFMTLNEMYDAIGLSGTKLGNFDFFFGEICHYFFSLSVTYKYIGPSFRVLIFARWLSIRF
jgi:hypothetical protein